MTHTPPAAAVRLPGLDGLRGIAILAVLVSHFAIYGMAVPSGGVAWVFYKVSQAGWVGVDLFFVLSGFLITGILYRSRDRERYFVNFYARRALRILPLYVAALAVTTLVLPAAIPGNPRLAGWVSQRVALWTFTTNLAIAQHGWTTPAAQGLDHFWSLAVEEQFYLLWPIAVWALSPRRLTRLCVIAVGVSIAFRAVLHVEGFRLAAYVLMPARMDALAIGALAALIATQPHRLAVLTRLAPALAAGSAVLLVAIVIVRHTMDPEDALVQTLGFTLLASFFAALLVLALRPDTTIAGRLMAASPLRFFGRYSYCLYIVHHPMLLILVPGLVAMLRVRAWPDGSSSAAAIVIVAVLSVAVALASWHLYEKWFVRMGRYFDAGRPVSGEVPAAGGPVEAAAGAS